MAENRKLTAILALDIVGYSRLMSLDEAGTARAVREHREAATPILTDFGGRIVKTMGDGLLLDFPSVIAAVKCAIAIQTLMAARNADVPDAKRIVYRIGANLGDVLIEGDDIIGEAVNIAARLEALCHPGRVLISSAAYDYARGKIDAEFVDLGEKKLKNIGRPVRVFEWAGSTPEVAARVISSATAHIVVDIQDFGGSQFKLIVGDDTTIDSILDKIWFRIRKYYDLPPYTYNDKWILVNRSTYEPLIYMGDAWALLRGWQRDERKLLSVNFRIDQTLLARKLAQPTPIAMLRPPS